MTGNYGRKINSVQYNLGHISDKKCNYFPPFLNLYNYVLILASALMCFSNYILFSLISPDSHPALRLAQLRGLEKVFTPLYRCYQIKNRNYNMCY